MSDTNKAVRAGTKRSIAIKAIEANPTKTISDVAAIMMESGKFSNIYDARGYYNYMVKHGFVSITEVVRDPRKTKTKTKSADSSKSVSKKTVERAKKSSSNSSELSVEEFRAKVASLKAA